MCGLLITSNVIERRKAFIESRQRKLLDEGILRPLFYDLVLGNRENGLVDGTVPTDNLAAFNGVAFNILSVNLVARFERLVPHRNTG